jgi:hypothetical protein
MTECFERGERLETFLANVDGHEMRTIVRFQHTIRMTAIKSLVQRGRKDSQGRPPGSVCVDECLSAKSVEKNQLVYEVQAMLGLSGIVRYDRVSFRRPPQRGLDPTRDEAKLRERRGESGVE